MNNYQQVVPIATHFSMADVMDTYRLRSDKGLVWLQKIAFWVLRKIGSRATMANYSRQVIDTRRVVDALIKQHQEIANLYHRTGGYVLIGPEELYRLMGEPTFASMIQPLSFESKYRFNYSICGMKVTVIPWMQGMLVLPQDVIDEALAEKDSALRAVRQERDDLKKKVAELSNWWQEAREYCDGD